MTSKYFSFFNDKSPASWVAHITRDFLPCYSCSYYSSMPLHCAKSVRIRSYFGPYFPTFGLNTEKYGESLRIRSECGKMRTRITPNTDTFCAVLFSRIRAESKYGSEKNQCSANQWAGFYMIATSAMKELIWEEQFSGGGNFKLCFVEI